MCLRFVFLLITRLAAWLRLSRPEETWKTAEILILRHQLAVPQRRQPRRPKLAWADRALLAALLGVIPNARRRAAALPSGCSGRAAAAQAAKSVTGAAARPVSPRMAAASASAAADGGRRALRWHGPAALAPRAARTFFSSAATCSLSRAMTPAWPGSRWWRATTARRR